MLLIVFADTLTEGHHAKWEVMLRKPTSYLILLEQKPACNVYYQISQLLPMSGNGCLS